MQKLIIMTSERYKKDVAREVSKALAEENKRYEWELLLKQANLATLQSQINPHFLYNTLECIRGMALMKNERDIADIASSLSNFFRYSISGKSDIVCIEDEFRNVDNYCRIQKYRFGNKFSLISEMDKSIGNCAIPKLTLQPIVENAIIHGLKDVIEGGEIIITARREGSNILITVSDNGRGMDVKKLIEFKEKIQTENVMEKDKEQGHTGIGILNVNRRIKLMFGDKYGISVYSSVNNGTDIEVLFPAQDIANE